MNQEQIRQFVRQYLQATDCEVLEMHPAYLTVKLSPEADKELTNRPYYWSFVERTGADAETMTFTYIFDPAAYEAVEAQRKQPHQQASLGSQRGQAARVGGGAAQASPVPGQLHNPPAQTGDTILGRYFGVSVPGVGARTLKETLTYGSAKLEQMFQAVRNRGRFVNLYEDMPQNAVGPVGSAAYTSWLGVNALVELACDRKRSELHSLGIHLSTGEIVERFFDRVNLLPLTPKLPARTHTREMISLPRAAAEIERYLEQKISRYDHTWADEAWSRLEEELARVESYYVDLLKEEDPEVRAKTEEQLERRKEELRWQYEPKVRISVTNCGLFHLLSDAKVTL
ncbi:hypothetical protein DUZ99_08405 [Xylanibacillus composti]|uniref:Uncharacterized protein n=1 Tax=Xylanibacillus composti TaxID=1572762 RepID=A0A8J4H5G4_9BACL|nr:YqhG family protein [Xylanibacillus composti]MDT9725015.1 hypothetical protein [Xylanibacillus composti]GIQ71308.1 hypothetical protein XYCOK13_41320 [Xylanibacillus composti]